MKTQNKITQTLLLTVRQYSLLIGLTVCFLVALPTITEAATLSLSPGTGVYTTGQTFTASVVVNTQGQSINAADGTLTFNPNELSVVGITKGSMFSLWTADPTYSNSAGIISFSGGSPTGYSGTAGAVMTISFRAKGSGASTVSFSKGSVLAADGRGTNVLTGMSGGSYTIAAASSEPTPEVIEYVSPPNTPAAPVITSVTHPDEAGYSNQTTAELKWQVPSSVTAVRTLLDELPSSIPTKVYDPAIAEISLANLTDGVQYLHVQFRNDEGWGRVAHYRIGVDTNDPNLFEISLPDNADLSNPEQILILTAEDETSEVSQFTIQIDGGEPYEYESEKTASTTVTLSPLEPGQHSVVIEAFDEAGNSAIDTLTFTISAFDRPEFTEYPHEISEDVIPVIKGSTRPNATVEITVRSTGVDDKIYTITSDEDGIFTFIPEGKFSEGVYTLTAKAIDQYGAHSEVSDPIKLAVQQPGFIRIGMIALSVMSVLVPLLALLIVLVALLIYGRGYLRRLRAGVLRESAEAVAIVDREFAELRSVLEQQKTLISETRKTRSLTKAETVAFTALEEAIVSGKKRVRKEVEDVEDVVE